MKLLPTLGLATGLLALAGCEKPGPEAGPRHDIKVRVEVKVPFSSDTNWSFQVTDEYKGNRQQLAGDGGQGGYYYKSFEHEEGNMAGGHTLTTQGSFSPGSPRSGSLPSTAYILMKIVVDGEVKADTTINSLMPASSSGERQAQLRVKF